MGFQAVFEKHSWQDVQAQIYACGPADVERALAKVGHCDLQDFMALLSPAAAPYLETMAALSQQLTQRRFGKTIQLYAPLYLSNECKNICTYCGFSVNNAIERLTLNEEQILQEAHAVKDLGFDHVLLVTGETSKVALPYFKKAMALLRSLFSNISLEVQPLSDSEYQELIAEGVHAVLVYQETYGPRYAEYHPRGKKRKFNFRLETADRLAKSGIHKIGLGCLIGLDDWRADSWFTALHLDYLEKNYWQTKFSISFPRLRPAEGCLSPRVVMEDRELLQLICAYRLFNETVELSLSTRETPHFRDHVFALGVTSMSAGSKTDPGGYSLKSDALEQFAIEDQRSPASIAAMLQSKGYETVWKDWDRSMS